MRAKGRQDVDRLPVMFSLALLALANLKLCQADHLHEIKKLYTDHHAEQNVPCTGDINNVLSNCTCTGTTVDCSYTKDSPFYGNSFLTTIPILPVNTTQFLATGQKISEIQSTSFVNCLDTLSKLDLTGNSLRTIADSNFNGVTNLSNLTLSNNLISSFNLTSSSDDLTRSVEYLYLNGNHLGGYGNPPLDLSALRNLRQLYLSGNVLTDVNLPPFLTYLDLSDCEFTAMPADVSLSMFTLETLKFNQNRITTLDGNVFANPMSGLNVLYMSECSIKNLNATFFDSTPVLTDLDLSSNLLNAEDFQTGTFASIGNSLQQLDLSYNTIGEFAPALCSDLSSLTRLRYENTALGNLGAFNGTCNLGSLSALDLSYNLRLSSIDDDSFISQLDGLYELNLSETQISEVACGALRRVKGNLLCFVFSHTNVEMSYIIVYSKN